MRYSPEVANGSIDDSPILICLLGGFRLLKHGVLVHLRSGGKAEALLSNLALRPGYTAPRELLLQVLWPRSEASMAAQSLHTLVYSLHKELGDAICGAAPVIHRDGSYRLNVDAGIDVDIAEFEKRVTAAEQATRSPGMPGGAAAYATAVRLYTGDLLVDTDLHALLERERLRSLHLTTLARLADYHYEEGNYVDALNCALAILIDDPCREDAHRLVMRCYLWRGERSQALRQYQLCERILRREFDAIPEPATTSLFDQIRLDPGSLRR